MPILHQWDYLFAFGVIFATLDAFNLGANDVANSFATSVSSKSLTMKQACFAAAICEFLGAVLVGERVADTIKNGIIKPEVFKNDPGVQLLAFTVALATSATWLMFATRMSWPVSTTYSIIAAVIGVGVVLGGTDAVVWGWHGGRGVATIFTGLIVAPAIAGGFASVVYLIVKFGLLARYDPVKWTLFFSPFVFFTVTAILTLSIIYGGAPHLHLPKLSGTTTTLAVIGTSLVVASLSLIFWLPYVYRKVVRKDYGIRWYHFFFGPLLWWRPTPPDFQELPADYAVPDYRIIRRENEEKTFRAVIDSGDVEMFPAREPGPFNVPEAAHRRQEEEDDDDDEYTLDGAWAEPRNLWIILRYKTVPFFKKILTRGITYDIHAAQAGKANTKRGRRMAAVYAHARQYPNEVEHLFSFVQVLTACTASFAHGSNDVSNAIGAFAVIYAVWREGNVAAAQAPVPIWMLAFGGVMIIIGLSTYGYNIMKVLGNKITLHSPSRGFSMEFGSAITVVLATQYKLPVSTTMCITGATLGVALCNGDIRAVNWRAIWWIWVGWILTVPVVATAAGCLMGIILNAPHFQS